MFVRQAAKDGRIMAFQNSKKHHRFSNGTANPPQRRQRRKAGAGRIWEKPKDTGTAALILKKSIFSGSREKIKRLIFTIYTLPIHSIMRPKRK